MKNTTLVIMAAGIGSRFGGGIKQLEPMGPNGEIIMDYSIYDAEEAGYAFKINSAYRSYEKQVNIYNGWVNQDGTEKADTYSARPGYSEHQTGYAFDVRDYPKTNDDYGKTKSFTWVSQNAHKYGFILRFPKGKEYITGYQYESWHYRYCGIECATYIYEHDITFEEYYEYFIKFNNPKNLT